MSLQDASGPFMSSIEVLEQPRICDDMNCTFPFGDICEACQMALSVVRNRTEESHRSVQQDTVSTWNQDIHTLNSQTGSNGSIFVAGTDEGVAIGEEIGEDDSSMVKNERWTEYSLMPEEFHGQVSAPLSRPSPPCQGSSINVSIARSSSPTLQVHPPVSSDVSRCPVPQRSLTPWLEELIDNTLLGQLNSDIFDGGAADRTSIRDPCPLCLQPLGIEPERSLHLMKCKYAHEENEILEMWMLKKMERQQ